MRKDYRCFYEPLRQWFLSHSGAFWMLKAAYKGLPCIYILIYALTVEYQIFWGKAKVLPIIVLPFTLFVMLSLLRHLLNFSRPYEGQYAITPLIEKSTKGHSFPSRHVSAASIIAVTLWYISVPLGIAMALLSAAVAATRLLAGVHYPRDIVGGFVLGYGLSVFFFVVFAGFLSFF